MTGARPGLAASDDPRGSYRTPLLLLGLTLALTAAAWSLAVREHEPSWRLRIEPLEDASELRIKLRVWGTRHDDLVVRRAPGESDRVWARRASRLAFSGLLALSIFFHAIGSYQDPYGWNREAWRRYGNLDEACWSWSYTQIGYQIRKVSGS